VCVTKTNIVRQCARGYFKTNKQTSLKHQDERKKEKINRNKLFLNRRTNTVGKHDWYSYTLKKTSSQITHSRLPIIVQITRKTKNTTLSEQVPNPTEKSQKKANSILLTYRYATIHLVHALQYKVTHLR
jgi:hypothetical protein